MRKKILSEDEDRASRGLEQRSLPGIADRTLPAEGKSAPSCLPATLTSAPSDASTIRFSTDHVPEKDRIAMWREHFGRTALRVEIEPIEEGPFEACVTSRILPGLHLLEGGLSAARLTRTRELISDGNDDLFLLVIRTGSERRTYGGSLALRIPRSILSSLIVDVDGATMRTIPRESGALKLLESYMKALIDEQALTAPELQHLVASHVSDLAALTLGATRDAKSTARARGVPAARLRAAKTYIIENSHRRDLSIGMVAAHLGVTPRYLQRLFEGDGKTFSTWLLNQRLIRAHRMLCKARFSEQAVSAIAYGVGFGDLSYFNRCFRRLYGITPRDVREAATI